MVEDPAHDDENGTGEHRPHTPVQRLSHRPIEHESDPTTAMTCTNSPEDQGDGTVTARTHTRRPEILIMFPSCRVPRPARADGAATVENSSRCRASWPTCGNVSIGPRRS